MGTIFVEWAAGVALTDQETHELLCDAVYWNSVSRAPGWYIITILHTLKHNF